MIEILKWIFLAVLKFLPVLAIIFIVFAAGTIYYFFKTNNPMRNISLGLIVIYLLTWPAFCVSIYFNQRRGLYPPEADSIVISMFESLVPYALFFPVFVLILMMSIKLRNWQKGITVTFSGYLLIAFWLVFISVGGFEIYFSIKNALFINIVLGLIHMVAGILMTGQTMITQRIK